MDRTPLRLPASRAADRARGGALPTMLILVLLVGIHTLAIMQATTAIAQQDFRDEQRARLLLTANAGLETLRLQMYFTNVDEFTAYIDNAPDYPAAFAKQDGSGMVLNGTDITWSVYDDDAKIPGEVVAEVVARNGRDEITVIQTFRLPSLAQYAFASNNMHDKDNGRVDSYFPESDWYGNVYWWSRDGTYSDFRGPQRFHGNLESWDFREESGYQPESRYAFLNPDGSEITHDSALEESRWTSHEYRDSNSLADFARFGENVPVDRLFDSGWSGSYPNTATYKFDGSNGSAEDVELFYAPDGEIYWRNLGGSAADWTYLGTQEDAVIYVKGTAVVRGVVSGKSTVAAEDIYINGNIVRQSNYDALGLISYDDIYYEGRRVHNGRIQQVFENEVPEEVYNNDDDYEAGDDWTTGKSLADGWLEALYWHRNNGNLRREVEAADNRMNYLADPALDPTIPWQAALIAKLRAEDSEFWDSHIANWTADNATLPGDAVIEASQFAHDVISPTVDWNLLNWGYWWIGSDFYGNAATTTWRSGGTIFSTNDWPNSRGLWDVSQFGEHPWAESIQPPGFLQENEGVPEVKPGNYQIIED